MLRLQYRFAFVAATLVLVALGLFLKTNPDLHVRLELGNNSKAWIYSGPEAEDKAVIMAKVQNDDVDWVFNHLPECMAPALLLWLPQC